MTKAPRFSTEQMRAVEKSLNDGEPFVCELQSAPQFRTLCEQAAIHGIVAHRQLYIADPERRVVFGKTEGEEQYISWDLDGKPCFAPLNPAKPHTDVGIRGVNLDAPHDETNQTTVVHTTDRIERYVSSNELSLTVAMERLFNLADYARRVAVEPYLKAVAEINGIDPDKYARLFFNPHKDWSSVMRAIMYHSGTSVKSADNKQELLIKEHADRSGFTAGLYTSGPGLQYRSKNGRWHDAQPTEGITIFPGAGEQHLPTPVAPIVHRVQRNKDTSHTSPETSYLGRCQKETGISAPNIGRLALPFFVSSQEPYAKTVLPHSSTTHPTYQRS